MQATPCGVEEREDPEFWQCACEQQICSRPRADWQLSGGRVAVWQARLLSPASPHLPGHLPSSMRCLAGSPLLRDNT